MNPKILFIINSRMEFLLKVRCVGKTLGEYNIVDVWFEYLKKCVLVKPARYVRNFVIETSGKKGPFKAWLAKVLTDHTIEIRRQYRVKDIDRRCRLEMVRRDRNQALEIKVNIPRAL